MKLASALLVGLSLFPAVGFSAEAEKKCTDVEMSQVSYYSVLSVTKDQKIGDVYKKQVEELKSFSKKHKLEHFKILSQDISISQNSYSQDTSEISISIYFESKFDYSLLDKIRSELRLSSFSSSRSLTPVCE